MWSLQQFEKTAKDIAVNFVMNSDTTSVNQLATKLAENSSLNPDQIRTMVRLANVAVFQQLFEKKADGDKMIEFEPGDAEVVINNLHKKAEGTLDLATQKTANYFQAQDYYGDFVEEVTKEAEAPAAEEIDILKINPYELGFNLKEATDCLQLEKYEAEFVWKDRLEKAASMLKKTHGSAIQDVFPSFEKDAIALVGVNIAPELTVLKGLIGGDLETGALTNEKIASISETHIAIDNRHNGICELLKVACESRYAYTECQKGQELLATHSKKLNAR
jgi:hypothetical protein